MTTSKIYLIPTVLAPSSIHTIPNYILNCIKECDVFFVENEKTTRQYFKQLWKEMVIDNYQWHTIHKAEKEVSNQFINYIKQGKTVGIVSEAGCPCIADPGQILVAQAHKHNAKIMPLVGPNSILMALMASGLNGQSFQFIGYLPIDSLEKRKKIKEIELYSTKNNCTQIFIETPYRNNQILKEMIEICQPNTMLCVAVDISSAEENIIVKSIAEWKKTTFDFHKKPATFLLLSMLQKK
jgi:16S rRNA (cytidine1402-2'-O)-methyltransferase